MITVTQTNNFTKLYRPKHTRGKAVVPSHIDQRILLLLPCVWYENLTQYFKEERALALSRVIDKKSRGNWAADIARSIDDTYQLFGAELSLLLIKFAFLR